MPTVPDRALDRLYPMPRPMRTMEEWTRLHHHDLSELSDLDLDREAFAIARRLCHDSDRGRVAWLVERRDAIRTERRRRADEEGRRRAAEPREAVVWRRPSGAGHGAPGRRPLRVRRGGEVVEL